MLNIGLALVWLAIVMGTVAVCAVLERSGRLSGARKSGRWTPPRAAWGFDAPSPPAAYMFARALAGGARLVRSGTRVDSQSRTLRSVNRILSSVALASALALIPYAGTWGGQVEGRALAVADSEYGLVVLVFLLLVMGFAQVGAGLADRNIWSRMGSASLAGQMLAGLGLFILVLAPLAIESASFRFQDIVASQQATFSPSAWLPENWQGAAPDWIRAIAWPSWNLFLQPLTAILFVLAFATLTRRPWVRGAMSGAFESTGFGLDSDPVDLYWGRLEARLAKVLGAALFVTLFLGAGAIPFVSNAVTVEALEPFVGFALPAFLALVLGVGVFFAKMVLLIVLLGLARRSVANLRNDQWLNIVARRLIPIAWANLLLMSAIFLYLNIQLGVG